MCQNPLNGSCSCGYGCFALKILGPKKVNFKIFGSKTTIVAKKFQIVKNLNPKNFCKTKIW